MPLRDFGDPDRAGRAGTRRDSFRHVRRVSNWTGAALIVGTAAAAGALAHQAFPAAGNGDVAGAGTSASSTGASAPGAGGPQVTHSVATTTASGVTVTTATRTINGKTVVTQVRHAPAYADSSYADN